MTDQQFDVRLKHIEEQAGALRERADAYRDQEMARLFVECEWTQERIAERMGKRQSWVCYRLKFGAFLSFITSGDNRKLAFDQLTERRFREQWKLTKGKEEERFEEVTHRLEHGIPHGVEALKEKPPIRKAVEEVLKDGKWYTSSQITATVEESLHGVTEDQVRDAIGQLRGKKTGNHPKIEVKKIGKKCQYRLKAKPAKEETHPPLSPLLTLYEEVAPLIEELEEWGSYHEMRQSPSALRVIAFKLRKIFDSVLQGEKV